MPLLCYSLNRETTIRPTPETISLYVLYEAKKFTLHEFEIKTVHWDQKNVFALDWWKKGWFPIWIKLSHLLRSAPKQTHILNTCTQLLSKWSPFQTIRKIKRRLIYITMPYAHLSCHGHDDLVCHWWHKQLLIVLNNIIYWREASHKTCGACAFILSVMHGVCIIVRKHFLKRKRNFRIKSFYTFTFGEPNKKANFRPRLICDVDFRLRILELYLVYSNGTQLGTLLCHVFWWMFKTNFL